MLECPVSHYSPPKLFLQCKHQHWFYFGITTLFIQNIGIAAAWDLVNFIKYEDSVCTGGDLQRLEEILLETCEDVCLQNPMCMAFVLYPVVPYVCWLKQTCDENTLSVVTGQNTYIRKDGMFISFISFKGCLSH